MKQLKRQARELINDITEKHCVPCEKKDGKRSHKDSLDFQRNYCAVHCAAGRDLKKLGEYLDKPKGDKVVKVKVKPIQHLTATKENCVKLLAEGKKNSEIAEIFGISEPNLYYKKNTWGLSRPKKESPKKENKSFGQHLANFIEEKEAAAEMPKIEPDYSREIEKYETEIAGLKESNKLLSEKLKQLEHIQGFDRETYQQNAELKQTAVEQSKTITAWINEYKLLQKKYESLVTYTKEIM
jgi:transposase-like protein